MKALPSNSRRDRSHDITSNQPQFLLELARATLESLQSAPLESVTDVNPDAVKNSLKAALDWARQEESAASLEAVPPSTGAEPSLGRCWTDPTVMKSVFTN